MGISQAKLATLIGVKASQVCDLENERTTTSIERLWLLSEIFGVTSDYLIGRSNERK